MYPNLCGETVMQEMKESKEFSYAREMKESKEFSYGRLGLTCDCLEI